MGIFDDDDLEFIEQARKEANKFRPQELNEANVQAIFNRCLAKKDTMSIARAVLFPIFLGYDRSEDIPIRSCQKFSKQICLWDLVQIIGILFIIQIVEAI